MGEGGKDVGVRAVMILLIVIGSDLVVMCTCGKRVEVALIFGCGVWVGSIEDDVGVGVVVY